MKNLLTILMFTPILASAQTTAQKADELINAYTNQQKFAGNVLIAEHGKIVFQKSYGYADLNAKRLNTSETEFRVGSLTKMFTSALIIQLAEAGKLSLRDAVSKFIPNFANGEKITIQNLLSHTSGIKGSSPQGDFDLEKAVTSFKSDGLAFAPGERFEYNNFNYLLLTYIAQKVTGKPYNQLLKRQVLDKAGMAHSGIDHSGRVSNNRALGYVTTPNTTNWQQINVPVEPASGAGALYATVGDIYKWSKVAPSGIIYSKAMFNKATSVVKGNYGLGWIINEKDGRKQIGHNGSIHGFKAFFGNYPKEDITIVFISNYGDLEGAQLAADLEAIVFNQPYKLPVRKTEIVLSSDAMAKLTGTYRINEQMNLKVFVENNKLYGQADGDPMKMELVPETDHKFFLRGPETPLEFVEEAGKIKYLFIDSHGGQKLMRAD